MKCGPENDKAETPENDDKTTADAEWAIAAERRERELAEGHAHPVKLEYVLDRLRARL